MAVRAAAFDLEIARLIPPGASDFFAFAPLGITCAAVASRAAPAPRFWQGVPQMGQADCQALVAELQKLVTDGYKLVTWNGCAFDFRVLAQESGLPAECAELAAQHTDLMFIVTCLRGHYLGLDKALHGAGLAGKRRTVTLSNGSLASEMSGTLAPQLWADGEHEAVLSYLGDDVKQLLELAEWVETHRAIRWTSIKGNPNEIRVPQLYSVRECFRLPLPDTAWMANPPARTSFVQWIIDVKAQVAAGAAAPAEGGRSVREQVETLYAGEADRLYWRHLEERVLAR